MKKIQSQILFFVIFVAISSLTYAGNRPGALTLTIGPGYEFFASSRHMQNTGLGYFAVGYDFTRNWGIEGLIGFLRTDFDKSIVDDRNIYGTLSQVDAVYHYPLNETFQPYVFAGFGLTTLNPNRDEAVDEGNLNGGVGLQFFMFKDAALRFEARDVYVINGGKNDVLLSAGFGVLFDLC